MSEDKKQLDITAGEYVLGTLSSEEKSTFEQQLLDNPKLDKLVLQCSGPVTVS